MRCRGDDGSVEMVVGVAVFVMAMSVIVAMIVPTSGAILRRQAWTDATEIASTYATGAHGADCARFFGDAGLGTDVHGNTLTLPPECRGDVLTTLGGDPAEVLWSSPSPGSDTSQTAVVNGSWTVEIVDFYRVARPDGTLGCGASMHSSPRHHYSDDPVLPVRHIRVNQADTGVGIESEAVGAATGLLWRSIDDGAAAADSGGSGWMPLRDDHPHLAALTGRADAEPVGGAAPVVAGCRVVVVDP